MMGIWNLEESNIGVMGFSNSPVFQYSIIPAHSFASSPNAKRAVYGARG